VILIATGSEVCLAVETYEELLAETAVAAGTLGAYQNYCLLRAKILFYPYIFLLLHF
jgi:transketolase